MAAGGDLSYRLRYAHSSVDVALRYFDMTDDAGLSRRGGAGINSHCHCSLQSLQTPLCAPLQGEVNGGNDPRVIALHAESFMTTVFAAAIT